jgi:hypothetical protein
LFECNRCFNEPEIPLSSILKELKLPPDTVTVRDVASLLATGQALLKHRRHASTT